MGARVKGAVTQVPVALSNWLFSNDITAWQFLLAVNLILLIWVRSMDSVPGVPSLTPVMIPVADALNIKKIHFWVVMAINLAIGLFAPPFGIDIFFAQSALKTGTGVSILGCFRFLALSCRPDGYLLCPGNLECRRRDFLDLK
ncbi:MAG: TRAP transporter large permease subunit [Pseudomonadota bacterium]